MSHRSMSGIHKGNAYKLILLALALVFWVGAIYNQKLMEASNGSISIRYREALLTKQQIDQILEGMRSRKDADTPQVTLWKSDEQKRITNEDIGRFLQVKLITVAGDISGIIQGSIESGGYLSPGDTAGCILDRNTAYELFGSENVIGRMLEYDNREYTVRGVLNTSGSNTMLIQAGSEKGPSEKAETYRCMELSFAETGPDKALSLAKNFVQIYGLGEPVSYSNGYRYQGISEFLVHLPIWLCVFGLILYSIRAVYRLRASLLLSLIGYVTVIAISMLLIRIADIHFHIPGSLLPNRWSDFDFWAAKGKELLAPFQGSKDVVQYYKETVPIRRLLLVISGVLVTVIAECCLLKAHKNSEASS